MNTKKTLPLLAGQAIFNLLAMVGAVAVYANLRPGALFWEDYLVISLIVVVEATVSTLLMAWIEGKRYDHQIEEDKLRFDFAIKEERERTERHFREEREARELFEKEQREFMKEEREERRRAEAAEQEDEATPAEAPGMQQLGEQLLSAIGAMEDRLESKFEASEKKITKLTKTVNELKKKDK